MVATRVSRALGEELQEPQLPGDVEVVGGLVQQHDRALLHQAAGEDGATALAARELVAGAVDAIGEPDGVERGDDELALVLAATSPGPGLGDPAERHHLAHEQLGGHDLLLGHEREPTGAVPGAEVVGVDERARGVGHPTSPSTGCSTPARTRSSVDLPAPLTPTMPSREPAGTSRSTPRRMSRPPSRAVTPRRRSAGAGAVTVRRRTGTEPRPISSRNSGAPTTPVTTPSGISCGRTASRARTSTQSRKSPPPSAATGSTTRCRAPTTRRAACGTISPTKPIPPLTATRTPTSTASATNSVLRSAATLTPRAAAVSESGGQRVQPAVQRQHAGARPRRRTGPATQSFSQVAPPTLPSIQNMTVFAARASSLRKTRKEAMAESPEDSTTPESTSRRGSEATLGRGDQPDQDGGADRAEQRTTGDGVRPESAEYAGGDGGGRADGGARADAEQVGVGERVAHQRLHAGARRPRGRRRRPPRAVPGAGASSQTITSHRPGSSPVSRSVTAVTTSPRGIRSEPKPSEATTLTTHRTRSTRTSGQNGSRRRTRSGRWRLPWLIG